MSGRRPSPAQFQRCWSNASGIRWGWSVRHRLAAMRLVSWSVRRPPCSRSVPHQVTIAPCSGLPWAFARKWTKRGGQRQSVASGRASASNSNSRAVSERTDSIRNQPASRTSSNSGPEAPRLRAARSRPTKVSAQASSLPSVSRSETDSSSTTVAERRSSCRSAA